MAGPARGLLDRAVAVASGKGLNATPSIAIIGAGAGGLAGAARLKRAGISSFTTLEKNDDVGGTWRDNTYPGAGCDMKSHLYSFSFELNPHWSKTYADQPEILAHLESVADRLGLRAHLRCNIEVVETRWDDDVHTWHLRTSAGESLQYDVVVSCLGMLNAPAVPDFPGAETFPGGMFHSARWDHGQDLTGRRVGVIGTGASAIQIIPAIAPVVDQLSVFQRSPAWVLPKPLRFRRLPGAARWHRFQIWRDYEKRASFRVADPSAELMRRFALSYLEAAVADPDLRARLTPDYPVGCKRILVHNDYLRAMSRPNVDLVTTPIERVDTAWRRHEGRCRAPAGHDRPVYGLPRGRPPVPARGLRRWGAATS